jgi:heme/copper-type cytochrome/quinol oxidase subunit 2
MNWPLITKDLLIVYTYVLLFIGAFYAARITIGNKKIDERKRVILFLAVGLATIIFGPVIFVVFGIWAIASWQTVYMAKMKEKKNKEKEL